MESAKCLSRLQRLCSRAEYCRQDMYRKALKDLEGNADAAERIVAQLVAEPRPSPGRNPRCKAGAP